ncbi:C-mannosyltransferase dpy-19 [Dermatophagoides pteronyssinus]|uniref:C-mannosyltransferase dpy-19 n=1 Tax=Dermatophagoides pteronyssinus TaxID=6956 RepID=UPI003F6610AB
MLSQKLLISSLIYIFYIWYINRMFENDRSYQYLTEIEREMSMTSEQSLYYYYYKALINNDNDNNNLKTFSELLNEKIFNDNRSNAPNIVNSFKILTILPEIFLAISYRIMRTILIDYFNVDFDQDWRRCYLVETIDDDYNDGSGGGGGNENLIYQNESKSIITTCEGIGEPFYFYIYSVFILNGFVPVLIGWLAYYLANQSICSMLMAMIMFLFNQTESSRVQWSISLRENFGYPLFLFHQFCLIRYLYCGRMKKSSSSSSINNKQTFCLLLLIVTQLLCWQFSSFILLIQTLCLYLSVELLPNIINDDKNVSMEKFLQKYFLINIAAILLQSMLQLGNLFVLRSPYFLFISSYLSASLLLSMITNFSSSSSPTSMTKRKQSLLKLVFIITIMIWNIIVSKYLQTRDEESNEEYSHIWTILMSKFSPEKYNNFHSFLYICSKEYDWIKWPELYSMLFTKTFIGPLTILAFLLQIRWLFIDWKNSYKSIFIYHFMITGCFGIMAIMIMRLKLLMMPQLAISTGLIFSNNDQQNNHDNNDNRMEKLKQNKRKKFWFDWLLLGTIISIISIKSYPLMREYLENQQQFSNESFEHILDAIQQRTPYDSIIGGSMSTMATVMLSTDRKIANNPFYESTSIRQRTYDIYQLYSERPFKFIHKNLCHLKIQYIIIETIYCFGKFGQNCRMIDIWKYEDKRNDYWQQQSTTTNGQQRSTNGQPDKQGRLCQRLIGRRSMNNDENGNGNGNEDDEIFKYFQPIASNDLYYLYKIDNC